MKTMQRELEQWGKWVRAGGADCAGYKSQMLTLLVQNVPQPGRREPVMITDERAVEIDKAIARLTTRDREMGLVVLAYYLSGRDFRGTAAILSREYGLHMSHERVRVRLYGATAWLDGVLNGGLKNAA